MKRILTLFLFILSLAQLTVSADSVMWVDYCDGTKASSSSAVKSKESIDIAVRFSAEKMANFAGNEIRMISVGWPVGNPGGSVTVWVRESQSGANVVEQTVAAASGWMEVKLDTPYQITGDKECWVGVTYKANSTLRSFISLAGPTHEDGSYYRVGDGEWQSYASLGKGSLAIRAGINGPNMPKHDISVSSISTPRSIYVFQDKVPVSFTFVNNAFDACVDPKVRISLNGTVVAEETVSGNFEYSKTLASTITVPTDCITEVGQYDLTLEALWADGEADNAPADNVAVKTLEFVKPEFDLMLSGVKCASTLFQCGDPIGITGTIRNLQAATCVNPIVRYSLNGGEVTGEQVIEVELGRGENTTIALRIPTERTMAPGTVTVDLELVPNHGVELNPEDNSGSISGLRFEEHPMIQKMVVEEGTGTWCGFCVRGLYGMEKMTAEFPERFIGIAIHSGDTYQLATYTNWMNSKISGYPSSLFNREGSERDPNYEGMLSFMKNTIMRRTAELEVTPTAYLKDGAIYMDAECYVGTTSSNRKLYLVFVITEDECFGIQHNYYAGGGRGPMGGFENLPDEVPVMLPDVARGVWPSPNGDSSCALPSSIEAGKTYTVGTSVKVGSFDSLSDDNLYVTAMVVDGSTRKVVNAGRCPIYGMSAVIPEGVNTVLRPEAATDGIYNLAGQRVGNNAGGLRIEGGRKVLR